MSRSVVVCRNGGWQAWTKTHLAETLVSYSNQSLKLVPTTKDESVRAKKMVTPSFPQLSIDHFPYPSV